jgi:hypothetical protein
VVSETEKQKVIDAAAGGNKPKIDSSPVVAIIAYDTNSMIIQNILPRIWMQTPFVARNRQSWKHRHLKIAGFKLAF